ncbi:DEAD box helicase, putative [Plasmodium gallinaceum]|uniref:DEAD box helicase, putative n=1 Tax=Plasmodium gallinaceum TaxID=5849 RepID=A0A1J1GVG3_PLAGA|nr:DEAD box helicase, putative [Plasmodium gallinaceum]CRG95035.1 DEAD box helicase, putative [Plasmodium gallinaceum]
MLSNKKKEKKANPLICHRRLGIYKKKIYENNKQLIYVSLSGHIYTNNTYKEIVKFDNNILNELNISKTGNNSSINNVKLFYNKLNESKINGDISNCEEKKFEYYFIPDSIIKEYNNIGIYELYKDQIECLKNIFHNEEIENNLKNKNDEEFFVHRKKENVNFLLDSDFFLPIEKSEIKDIKCLYYKDNKINESIRDKENEYKNYTCNNNIFYKNFIFNITTGMGKTVIYDILIIRFILYKGYRVVLSLPTMSLINEKSDYYEKLLGNNTVSLNIKKFNSLNFTGYSYNMSTDIALCTYEQANIIVNIIIKNNLKCNYIFIIDEIHYINDIHRGFFIESLLTKIKFIQKNYEHLFYIRTYSFSATLSNIDQLGEWLNAKVYVSKEKLYNIKYLYKIKNIIYKDLNINEIERKLDNPFLLDPDHLVYLISEELILKKNVLIFCPTRDKTEKVASFISNVLPYYLKNKNYRINKRLLDKRIHLINELKKLNVKIENLEKLILNGIFFHHSQLDKNEKEIIENSFKNNILFCLCCTTTLSVGVNLNVHTVIIRSLRLGNTYLTKDQIIQMAGRCGRTKKVLEKKKIDVDNYIDSEIYATNDLCNNRNDFSIYDYDIGCDGKVLIFLNHCDKNYLEKIFSNNFEMCKLKTKLHNFQLCKFILEFIHLELIKTKKDMFDLLFFYTLKFFKIENSLEKEKIIKEIKQNFQFLFENKLIIIPYEKEQIYYHYLFSKIYNLNLYKMSNFFDFQFLNEFINIDILMKCDLKKKKELFNKLLVNYKFINNKKDEKSFFTLPFITILLIFKDTQFNKNLFQNLFVQLIKYLFIININEEQYNFYVYDILNEEDNISCTELSSYFYSIFNVFDFIFNYSLIQYTYIKGFPTDSLLMIFVFCMNSEVSLKIHFDIYEEILKSNNNIYKIFQYFGLQIDKLHKFKLKKSDDLYSTSLSILKGEIDIDKLYENFEWIKIKRFYFSLIVYDVFKEDLNTVSYKYRLKTNEVKNLYIKSCYILSFNFKILRNFRNSLDIFCIVLENLLSKMKSKNFLFKF